MLVHSFNFGIWVCLALAGLSRAHIVAWTRGMYCLNGTDPTANPNNNNAPVKPLYMLPREQYWMHHVNGCDDYPPAPGDIVELTPGGTLKVELAGNRAWTTLNTDPNASITNWGDGKEHPDDYTGSPCIFSPNLHTQNQSMAAGTAWAIAYEPDPKKVTLDALTVISVLYHTPWQREATYDIPPSLPPCPPEGCTCVWGWIPDGCGQPNMYMFPYKCNVTSDGTPPKTLGKPQPPVWCEDDESKCVQGPKQFMIWNQAEGNNIEVEGRDLAGQPKSPAYNMKCGFKNGAQTDIYVDSSELIAFNGTTGSNTSTSALPSATSASPGLPTNSSTPIGSGTQTSASLGGSATPASGVPTDPSTPVPYGSASFSSFPSSAPSPSLSLAPTLFSATGSVTPSVDPNVPRDSGMPHYSDSQSSGSLRVPPYSSWGRPTDGWHRSDSAWPDPSSWPTCSPSPGSSAGTRRATHSKRQMRREKRVAF